MSRSTVACAASAVFLAAAAAGTFADESRQQQPDRAQAIRKDREIIAGSWRITSLVVNGKKVSDEDARKLTVRNHVDGTWVLRSEGEKITGGTSTIDPTKKPKTIDFTPNEGDSKGQLHLGIYQLDTNTRKLCFAPPGKGRPTEFASREGSQDILVTFERQSADSRP